MEKKVILPTGASSGIGFNGSAGSSMVAWRGSGLTGWLGMGE